MALRHDSNRQLWPVILAAGLESHFDEKGVAVEDCPACDSPRSLRLNLRSGRAGCLQCGIEGPLETYIRERMEGLVTSRACDDSEDQTEADIILLPTPPRRAAAAPAGSARLRRAADLPRPAPKPAVLIAPVNRPGHMVEKIIMTLLALLFLSAGLAAAALSGYANYLAFGAMVSDPLQSRVWGWAGVIASVCSFGGFTFFWWHMTHRRRQEGARTLIFALAGAATSIAGTSLFMDQQAAGQSSASEGAAIERQMIESQLVELRRQLDGIPAETRSIAGLQSYLEGVERAGRSHQKPYRDAQNELGLAQRRARLEADMAAARGQLIALGRATAPGGPAQLSLPSWAFALMLEVFSSQATSIACVSLLLLYGLSAGGARPRRAPD